MTAFDSLRDWEPAAPRPWLTARRLAAATLGMACAMACGAVFAVAMWMLL